MKRKEFSTQNVARTPSFPLSPKSFSPESFSSGRDWEDGILGHPPHRFRCFGRDVNGRKKETPTPLFPLFYRRGVGGGANEAIYCTNVTKPTRIAVATTQIG